MICRDCRKNAALGARNCQRCGRHCSSVLQWDRFKKSVLRIGVFIAVVTVFVLYELSHGH